MAQESTANIAISGVVKKQEATGAVVLAQATVLAAGPDGMRRMALTNAKGEYTLTGLMPGEWKIMAWHDECAPAMPQVVPLDSAANTVAPNFTLEEGKPEFKVEGEVRWYPSHRPGTGAVVQARAQKGLRKTGEAVIANASTDGAFTISKLRPGRYAFTVLHENGQAKATDLFLIEPVSDLQLDLYRKMDRNDKWAGWIFFSILSVLLILLVGAYLALHAQAPAAPEPLLPVFVKVLNNAQIAADEVALLETAATLTDTAQLTATMSLSATTDNIRSAWNMLANTTNTLTAEKPLFTQLVADIEAAHLAQDAPTWARRVTVLNRLVGAVAGANWFWTQEPWRFMEVLFWGFAGALVNLIIVTGRYLRFERFYSVGIPMHLAQLITVPLLALVFVFLLSQVTFTVEVLSSSLRIDLSDPLILAAVSFLLGSRFWQLWDFLQDTADKLTNIGERKTDADGAEVDG